MIVNIDTDDWTQEQKNMTHAMVSSLLFKSGITHNGISVKDGVIDVISPSAEISNVLKESNIVSTYNEWKEANDVKTAEWAAENILREKELNESVFMEAKLDEVNNYIDNINDLSALKIFLKNFVRYIKARGI